MGMSINMIEKPNEKRFGSNVSGAILFGSKFDQVKLPRLKTKGPKKINWYIDL